MEKNKINSIEIKDLSGYREELARLQEISPKTRYSYGENVTLDETKFSLSLVEKIYKEFNVN